MLWRMVLEVNAVDSRVTNYSSAPIVNLEPSAVFSIHHIRAEFVFRNNALQIQLANTLK